MSIFRTAALVLASVVLAAACKTTDTGVSDTVTPNLTPANTAPSCDYKNDNAAMDSVLASLASAADPAARKTAIATEKDKLAAIAGKAGNPDANDVAALKLACATLEARAYSVLVELPEGALSPDPASAAQAAVDKALLMCGPTASPRHCAVARHIGATLPARVRLRDLEAAADDEAAVDFPRLLNSATAMKTEVESKWAEARRQAAASDVQVAANAGADALKPSAELNNSMRSIACRVEHASVAALNDRSGLDAAGAEKDFADYSIPLMAALVAATDYDPAQSACYGKADSVCQRTLASSLIAKCAAQAPRVSLTN